MMVKILTVATLMCLSLSVSAQKIDNYKRTLAQTDESGDGCVRIVEDADAADALRIAQNMPQSDRIKGFRVRIFYDNAQNARQMAGEVMSSFRSSYPGVSIYLTHESPNYKVTVGDCATMEEALKLRGRIQEGFAITYIVSENISLNALISQTE